MTKQSLHNRYWLDACSRAIPLTCVAFLFAITLASYAHAQSADAVLCDRLAAHPSDPDRPADVKGVASIVASDIPTAIKFCRNAANSNRRHMFELGRAYEANGQTQEAIAAYRKAADKGSTSAMTSLASLTSKGSSDTKSDGQTRKMFERAAKAGDPLAMNNIGMAYATGDGVPKDPVKARELFTKAAEADSTEAMFNLALMTSEGDGGPKNEAAARALFEKAAARDHVGAMERAGEYALAGRGGPKDENAAKTYFEKAAALGSQSAKDSLQRIKCPYALKDKSGKRVTDLCF